MSSLSGLRIEKPESVWDTPLKADFKKLFTCVSQAGAKAYGQDYAGAVSDLIEAATALGFKDKLPQVAWTLIFEASRKALRSLAQKNSDLYEQLRVDLDELDKRVRLPMENCEIFIDVNFLNSSGALPFLEELRKDFVQWLTERQIESEPAEEIANPVRREFVFALSREWMDAHEGDEDLTKLLQDNPFNKAVERERAWAEYDRELQEQTNAPVFEEKFGFRAVYIPLRAYCEVKPDPHKVSQEKIEREVVDLGYELKEWVRKADPRDAICYVLGGPGAGKSSFATVFAADMSRTAGIPVLLIPLKDFHVDNAKNLVEAMDQYISMSPHFVQNPLDPRDDQGRLLIVFDGLDELSRIDGRLDEEQAQIFSEYVTSALNKLNSLNRIRLQVLITGRELFVQREAPETYAREKVFHVLPYRVEKDEVGDYTYNDPRHLLTEDQREQWWKRYCEAKGLECRGIPAEMNRGELLKLTAEPLLNYLVAWIYSAQKEAFSDVQNRNEIYRRLVDGIYARRWAAEPHGSLKYVSQQEFDRVLESIALATWHGGGRKTTVAGVLRLCDETVLQRWVDKVKEGREKGITPLLISSFFKYTGPVLDPEQSFEFTHKSFEEYLTARRIVNELDDLSKKPDGKEERNDALTRWASLCGPTPMDRELLQFIRDEISLRDKEKTGIAAKGQVYVAGLIGHMLREGMPMHGLRAGYDYATEVRMARNAEEALLVLLDACARVSKQDSVVDRPSLTAFGNWISRLRGQRSPGEFSVCLDCLSHLNLHGQILYCQDFSRADLVWANLERADLVRAHLEGAQLQGAHLEEANLERADLVGADLFGANLGGANLGGADLVEANLRGANLEGADLVGAELVEANLRGANLRGANLGGADLGGANLFGANLGEADLVGANLYGANLVGANLVGADLQGAYLVGADLEGADLVRAHLEGAYLRWASNLTQEQLDTACGDKHTKLSDGLTIKPFLEEET